MTIKNNVTRLLESQGIPYEAIELPVEKLSALEAASFMGVDPDLVYKTIVAVRLTGGRSILALVPAPHEVNLKSLAKAVGEKKIRLATQREAEHLTGLQTGGISPLALLHRNFQVVVDDSAQVQEAIYISGGQRGLDIRIATEALIKITKAITASISR
ncbi:MAG: aminoacyl-tRNA deacylase [Chloroflexota bacterium]|nr:MAG: aminoacyl-tRNA deacylase [Chloroflexota bacterium]